MGSFQLLNWRRDKRALLFFAAVYILGGVLAFLFQERLVYFPDNREFDSCPEFAASEKIAYKGTRFYLKDTGGPMAVLYHGNAGSACDRSYLAAIFEQAGYSYLVVEYAGYSNDSVQPSHTRLKENVEHVVDFMRERKFPVVAVVGESIGIGFAAYHASLLPPDRLLLISPFPDF